MTLRQTKHRAVLIVAVVLCACDSSKQAQKLAEDQKDFQSAIQRQQEQLQWKLDKATAEDLFSKHYSDAPAELTPEYFTFVRCHEEPPTHEANKRTCATLQARVTKAEAKAQEKAAKEKASW